MKVIIATSENYNDLSMLRSVTYFYKDGSKSTHEVHTKRSPATVSDTLKKIVKKCNDNSCKSKQKEG